MDQLVQIMKVTGTPGPEFIEKLESQEVREFIYRPIQGTPELGLTVWLYILHIICIYNILQNEQTYVECDILVVPSS